MPRLALRLIALCALLLVLAPAAGAASVAVDGSGDATFRARKAAVLFSTHVRPLGRTTVVVLPRGVRPACVGGRRPCARRIDEAGGLVRWRVLRPVSFFVPSRFRNPLVRIANARGFDLSVTGCGVLRVDGTGTYSIDGRAVDYDGPAVEAVKCTRRDRAR